MIVDDCDSDDDDHGDVDEYDIDNNDDYYYVLPAIRYVDGTIFL